MHLLISSVLQLSQYVLGAGGVLTGEEAGPERYENIHGDRYEDIQESRESFNTNQVRRERFESGIHVS